LHTSSREERAGDKVNIKEDGDGREEIKDEEE